MERDQVVSGRHIEELYSKFFPSQWPICGLLSIPIHAWETDKVTRFRKNHKRGVGAKLGQLKTEQ